MTQAEFNQMLQTAIAQGAVGGYYTSKYSGEEIDQRLDGSSIYDYAVEGGYTGTEAEFQALMGSGPWATVLTANKDLYVAGTGSDSTGDGSQARPFSTIQTAINSLPKNLNGHSVTIHVAAGTYAGFTMEGFYGAGYSYKVGILIVGDFTDNAVNTVITTSGVEIYNCGTNVFLQQLDVTGVNSGANISVINCNGIVSMNTVNCTGTEAVLGMWLSNDNRVNLYFCEISEKTSAAIYVDGSIVFSNYIMGSGNTVCFKVGNGSGGRGGLLIGSYYNITGTTKYQRELGGIIFADGAQVV